MCPDEKPVSFRLEFPDGYCCYGVDRFYECCVKCRVCWLAVSSISLCVQNDKERIWHVYRCCSVAVLRRATLHRRHRPCFRRDVLSFWTVAELFFDLSSHSACCLPDFTNFCVLPTVHLSISLDSDHHDAHLPYFTIRQYNTTIIYMFRALHMLILRRF